MNHRGELSWRCKATTTTTTMGLGLVATAPVVTLGPQSEASVLGKWRNLVINLPYHPWSWYTPPKFNIENYDFSNRNLMFEGSIFRFHVGFGVYLSYVW